MALLPSFGALKGFGAFFDQNIAVVGPKLRKFWDLGCTARGGPPILVCWSLLGSLNGIVGCSLHPAMVLSGACPGGMMVSTTTILNPWDGSTPQGHPDQFLPPSFPVSPPSPTSSLNQLYWP